MTNLEKMKTFNIEEMADFLEFIQSCSHCRRNGNDCFPSWDAEEWLESEAEITVSIQEKTEQAQAAKLTEDFEEDV